jgi:hypothetical protein
VKKMHHYAVFLRTKRGTVRRNVALQTRSVAEAKRVAVNAVQRHLRGETVTVLDCVPMREKRGKAETTGRRKRAVTTTKTQWVLTRRPKARQSLVLTPRGVAPYEPERRPSYVVGRASEKVSERVTPTASCCSREACIKRGSCAHVKRPPNVERVTYTGEFKWQGKRVVMHTISESLEQARAQMRADLRRRGMKGARIRNIAATPGKTLRMPPTAFELPRPLVAK